MLISYGAAGADIFFRLDFLKEILKFWGPECFLEFVMSTQGGLGTPKVTTKSPLVRRKFEGSFRQWASKLSSFFCDGSHFLPMVFAYPLNDTSLNDTPLDHTFRSPEVPGVIEGVLTALTFFPLFHLKSKESGLVKLESFNHIPVCRSPIT